MIDANNPELSFKTEKEVEAYTRFFLGTHVSDIEDEYQTPEELNDFQIKRERQLKAQLDYFSKYSLQAPNKQRVQGEYYKITKSCFDDPLSSKGAQTSSSRFNYKNHNLFKTRPIYFGKTAKCCEVEIFHLEEQRESLRKLSTPDYEYKEDEIIPASYKLYKYEIDVENILVLTSKSCHEALNITASVINNEWYDINNSWDIPSASQLFGLIAKQAGFNGILYKSVRSQLENNLVLFEENTGKLSFKQIDNREYSPSEEILATSEQ
jgi:hypothetical protein